MRPSVALLPHVICSRPVFGGGGHEADQHGDTGRVDSGVSQRYARSTRKDRGRILDEFEALTGLRRKHAMRLLRGRTRGEQSGRRLGRRLYDDAVREALVMLWEASDRVCGKRLRPLIPILVESMERHGHLKLAPELRSAGNERRSTGLCKVKEQASLQATLDPVRLLSEIRLAQKQLVEIADRPATSGTASVSLQTLEQFLEGLRTSWQEGEVRPRAS